jgi:predicted anti-sigma-YlaC factor YlaD
MDTHMSHDNVKRLLGPAEPEVLCEECFERLDEYVELELQGRRADEQIPGMRAHLEGCPACREDHDSLRDFVRQERART